MKNITLLSCIVLLISYSCFIKGMESDIEYRQATNDDTVGIVDLINTYAYKDNDKIVIVPEAFRAAYIQSAIQTKRLFVASNDKTIVGYKKLFCITDEHECNDILNNELRCTEDTSAGCALISAHDESTQDFLPEQLTTIMSLPITYIYNGADFTHPQYRAQGINSSLTKYALEATSDAVRKDIEKKKSTYLAMVYGLTKSNAGASIVDGRTHGIFKQFVSFAQAITHTLKCAEPSQVILSRHHAFKPSFDPKATECKPLSDSQSIPGYGYLVACALDQNSNERGDL